MSNSASERLGHVAEHFLGKGATALDERERRVLQNAIGRRALSADTSEVFDEGSGFGERLADAVAAFGGSWRFLIGFALAIMAWVVGNLALTGVAPDPYPFIFLNLLLSMLAAVQAPVIMMSQNRQAAKDRLVTSHDYECNLKAEIEIMGLHEKVDRLRDEELRQLLVKQQEQIDLLMRLVQQRTTDSSPPESA